MTTRTNSFAILSVSTRKGIIETNITVATFWYKRVAEVAVLLSVAVGGIGFVSTYVLTDPFLQPLSASTEAIVSAAVTLVLAIVSLFLQHKRQTKWITIVVILSLSATLLLSMLSTGDMLSPYLPLWVLSALFASLVGVASMLPVSLGVAAYGVYLWQLDKIASDGWIIYGLSVVFPLIIGYLIWSRRFQAQEKSNQAVSALAQELNEESNKSEIIINAIADGVMLVDSAGIIQLINPAALQIIGWGNEDATKLDYRSVLKIIDASNRLIEGQLDPVQQCLRTNEVVLTEKFGIRTVSGKQLLSSILASPLRQPGSGVIVVFRDTTAQHAEEQGQAEFISTASHEMRTPVAAIEGYLGLALNPQTAAIDDKARMYIGKAQEAAQRLGRLFQDLLDISKVEDGRFSSKPTITDVTSFARSIMDDYKNQPNEKGLAFVFVPDTNVTAGQAIAPIFYANVDLDHLREVLSNLITNATKYTKEGSVAVDVTGDDDHVYISVKDTGIGIPAEDLPHLFQKFYRVDNSDTREIGGTGLGLYLARRLAEAMDGHLTVNSAYGEGSTFTVDLPRVSKEDALNAEQQMQAPEQAAPLAAPPTETKL